MKPFANKGYNVCTDNFFTGLSLARSLLEKRTTLVGTVRLNSKFLSPAHLQKKPLHDSEHFETDNGNVLTVSYQGKKTKKVVVLSTFHQSARVHEEEKKKPELIKFYNLNKVGVDSMDSMLRLYSVKAATKRWPLAVFYNIL